MVGRFARALSVSLGKSVIRLASRYLRIILSFFAVICSPSGESASLLGSCSPDLVARLTQPNPTQTLDLDPRSENLEDLETQRTGKKSGKGRKQHKGPADGIGPHVEVEFDGVSYATAEAGGTGRAFETLRNPSRPGRVELKKGPVRTSKNEHEELDTETNLESDRTLGEGPATAGKAKRGLLMVKEGSVGPSPSERECPEQSPDERNPDGRNPHGKISDGRNPGGPDRLILPVERVLVPLPDLRQCAAELRFSMGLETVDDFGFTKGPGGSGSSLAGWPAERELSGDDSGSESGSSVDTDAEAEPAEGQSQELGVKAEVAGLKRGRSEGLRGEDGPPTKVQKSEAEGKGLEFSGSGVGGGAAENGEGWWQDEGMQVGLLADFADFGDAFGDVGGFGEVSFYPNFWKPLAVFVF